MAKFDNALINLGKTFNYTGEPPSNEAEYDAMKSNITDAPTWSEVETAMNNITDRATLVASARTKLVNGQALTEEEAKLIVF